jgi:hypothetical protein
MLEGMNLGKLSSLLAATILLSGASAMAQYRFQFTFSGTRWTTNATGKYVAKSINTKSILKEYAAANGLKNTKNIDLVYHIGAEERGDVIEIISKTNGVVLYTYISLFFGTNFDRTALASGDGSQVKRIDYVYGHQINHSAGSTITTIQYFTNQTGLSKRVLINGQADWINLPDAPNASPQIISGTFTATRPVNYDQKH